MLCVNIRHVYENTLLSQFPTDDNDQEKVGKTVREEKEGKRGKRKEQNRGRGGEENCERRKQEGEAIAVWEEDMGVY